MRIAGKNRLTLVAPCALGALMGSNSAVSQDNTGATLEEVIVTATRVSDSVNRVFAVDDTGDQMDDTPITIPLNQVLTGEVLSAYLQDEWRIGEQLTLNFGLRWDRWPPNRDVSHLLTAFDPPKKAVVLGTDVQTMYKLGATIPSVYEREVALGVKFETVQDSGLPSTLCSTM